MGMEFKFKGLDKLRRQIVKNADLGDFRKEIKKHGAELQNNAMRKAPVDTGNLKRSITIEIKNDGMQAHIYPTAEYAPYVEYGTRYMTSQPFMRPSFQSQLEKFKADLQRLVK